MSNIYTIAVSVCAFISATMFRQINQAILVCAVVVVVNCFPDGGPADTCKAIEFVCH